MRTLVILPLILAAAGPALARYAYRDLAEVPVERLAQNVRQHLEEHPDDGHAWYVLGRVHAMAYARGTATLKAEVRQDPGGVGLTTPTPIVGGEGGWQFGVDDDRGLSDALQGASVEGLLVPVEGIDALQLLPAGGVLADPSEHLGSPLRRCFEPGEES